MRKVTGGLAELIFRPVDYITYYTFISIHGTKTLDLKFP